MKRLIFSTLIIPALTFAGSEPVASPFPGSHKGINIWPAEKINMPGKTEMVKSMKSFATKGFTETNDSDGTISFLEHIPAIYPKESQQYDAVDNELDTHLRSSLSKFRISFKFNGIPEISKENSLGFSPAGGYTHEKGWDGIVQFARVPDVGICVFTTMAIRSVMLAKESVRYEVNKKASDKNIWGNYRKGFVYRVNWYTDERMYNFMCTNKKFDIKILPNMIKIANKIDSSMSS